MENESRNSEEQSRKLIRIKNQWFVSTESESDSDDSAVCATSTPAESTFSKLGLLLAKSRLSLDGENVNKIIFCQISYNVIVCVLMYFKIKVVSLTLIVIGPFQKVGLGQKLQFATHRNKTNQIRIRKRELDASNNRSFASEIVSSDYFLCSYMICCRLPIILFFTCEQNELGDEY